MKEGFNKRLRDALYELDVNNSELADMIGVTPAAVTKYMKGESKPRLERRIAIADKLGISFDWLEYGEGSMNAKKSAPRPTRRSLPVLGKIACGEPIYDDGNVEFYFDPQNPVDADFCLIAEGDSMIGVHIQEGDIVFIRKQPMVENGQIAAVRIGDEFTLKRFYWDKLRSVVQLNAENPNYPPIIKTGAEIDEISVIGLAVGFQHSLIPGKKIAPSEGVTPTGREQ